LGYSVVGSLWVCGFHRGVLRLGADRMRKVSIGIGREGRVPWLATFARRAPGTSGSATAVFPAL